jgi:hypothetical protein
MICIASATNAVAAPPPKALPEASSFIENRGQWNARAHYLSRLNGLDLWVTQDGPVLEFTKVVRIPASPNSISLGRPKSYLKRHVVKMSFENADPTEITGQSELRGKYNYFLGNDRSRWVSGIKRYQQVVAEQPYPGIAMRYSINAGQPRYDVIVQPGADPSRVGLKLEGADGVQVLPNGDLKIGTSLGAVEERGLVAYQESPAGRQVVPCRMVTAGSAVHFDVGSYDPSRELIIDPLIASTYIGSNIDDTVSGVALDPSNNIYVSGTTFSPNFPTTVGALEDTSADFFTAFVVKLDPTEKSLLYGTYLGGNQNQSDYANCIVVDSTGNATVGGSTGSLDFPVTKGAFQTVSKTLYGTAFVTKLNATGSALIYSTYFGGGRTDSISCMAFSNAGSITVGGTTTSYDFPTTANAFQRSNKEAYNGSAFVSRLNSAGTALVFSTYLGGGTHIYDGRIGDSATTLAVDASGNTTVGGSTASVDFPVTSNAFQTSSGISLVAADYDAVTGFASRLDPTGSTLLFSTYLGGSSIAGTQGKDFTNSINSLALDSQGNVVIGGATDCSDFPTTTGAFMRTNPTFTSNGFVTCLARTGQSLIYSTYLGGVIPSNASAFGAGVYGLILNSNDDAIVTGGTISTMYPVTVGAFETADPAAFDLGAAFVTELKPDGTGLLYSSYLAGETADPFPQSSDWGTAVKLNSLGQVVVIGSSGTDDFPTTAGAFQSSYATSFITTLSLQSSASELVGISVSPNPVVGGSNANGSVTLSGSSTSPTTIHLSAASSSISVPLAANISAGAASGSFSITTSAVAVNTPVLITASLGGKSVTATLVVIQKLALKAFSLDASSVPGGNHVEATVLLNGAPTNDSLFVSISSNKPEAVVPNDVLVLAESSSAEFSILTSGVSAPETVRITVSWGSTTLFQDLTITPAVLAAFSLGPSSVKGGTNSDGIVDLPPGAPDGALVSISSSSPLVTVQSAMRIYPGRLFNSFPIITQHVTQTTPVTITVKYGNSTLSRTLTLTP